MNHYQFRQASSRFDSLRGQGEEEAWYGEDREEVCKECCEVKSECKCDKHGED